MTDTERLTLERVVMKLRMCRNTCELTSKEGHRGYLYSIRVRNTVFQMFAYYDTSSRMYQVLVISPEIEQRYRNAHDAHIFSDSRICFGTSGGETSLERAYSRSCLWATGLEHMIRTGKKFPFNYNQ